ncbi:MAG: hypothetical protein ABIS51_19880 [Sphingomonas sp.]
MTPEDRVAAWQSLQDPLTQTQAVADLDTLAIARSATAPLTPHGDGDRLMQRMLAITPAGSGADENASGRTPRPICRHCSIFMVERPRPGRPRRSAPMRWTPWWQSRALAGLPHCPWSRAPRLPPT